MLRGRLATVEQPGVLHVLLRAGYFLTTLQPPAADRPGLKSHTCRQPLFGMAAFVVHAGLAAASTRIGWSYPALNTTLVAPARRGGRGVCCALPGAIRANCWMHIARFLHEHTGMFAAECACRCWEPCLLSAQGEDTPPEMQLHSAASARPRNYEPAAIRAAGRRS